MTQLPGYWSRVRASFLGPLTQETGATASEYSILMGFIALVIFAGVGMFGIALDGVFAGLATEIQTALGIP